MWKNDVREGKGKEMCGNGDIYEGEYLADERVAMRLTKDHLQKGTDEHGLRIRIFTAALSCNHADGLGLAKFTYDGDTIPSDSPMTRMPGKMRHGHGVITYESGGKYAGQWENDKRSGKGKYVFTCGDVYEGEWLEGKYHGKG